MRNVKIGDVVHGHGYRHDEPCLMIVEKINFFPWSEEISSVSGTVVGESGKISTRKESILSFDQRKEGIVDYSDPKDGEQMFDRFANMTIEKKGGWVIIPDFEVLDRGRTLASLIRELDIGESIDVRKEDHSVNSCRASASLVGDSNGNIYRVSKTETGCTIMRVE